MLETDRLILRQWKNSDLDPFTEMGQDLRVMEYFPSLLDREDSEAIIAKIEKHIQRHGFGFWACELKKTAEFMGFIGLGRPDYELSFGPCVEIGWRLAHRFWGQGFAVEGAQRALEFGFKEMGLHEVVSFTAQGNLKSRRVMEKLNMVRDLTGDFDHPKVAVGHSLRRHVLYRIQDLML